MLVSIITSVYNCEKYVGDMIESIISQTHKDWEMIIIDDASTDKTWDVISSFHDDRIIKIRNVENKGLTANLNTAWSMAKGKYLFRIDGDDIAYSGRLSKQIEYMEEKPNIVILGGGLSLIGDTRGIVEPFVDPKFNKANLLFDSILGHPTIVIRKEAADNQGLKYDESIKYSQDYNLEYKAAQIGDVLGFKECVIRYRVHSGQVSVDKRMEQIKCADITRKMALSDLHITLSDEQFNVWSEFCRNELLDEKRYDETVKDIFDAIITNNKKSKIYDEESLKRCFEMRVNTLFNNIERSKYVTDSNMSVDKKYEYMFRIQNKWADNLINQKLIVNWLNLHQIEKIAIYGIGYMGKTLIDEISKSENIKVEYIIDNAASGDYSGIKIEKRNENLQAVDLMINTVIYNSYEILDYLSSSFKGKIISLDDLVHEVSLL